MKNGNWIYKNQDFEFEPLDDWIGFVYCITELKTNKKYIGKKLFWRKKILPVTKSRKRRKHTVVESDWQTYHGSSETVKLLLIEGVEFHREILRLCKSKGECSYYEAKVQFDRDVLLSDEYYNGIINCRINRSHLKIYK
jgi:hypothetical protein